MLKKIFIAAFMLALVTAQNVSAQEVLIYSDDDDYTYYVVTESIINRTQYRDNRTFDVTLRIYFRQNFDCEFPYQMWENDGIIWYTTGAGKGMYPVNDTEPMNSVWNYCVKFLNLDYEVSYK